MSRRLLPLALLLSAAGVAWAGDTWREPFPGIQILERTTPDPQRIFAAYVDLCAEGIHPRASRYEERGQRTSDWAESVGAQVAVNGAFFSYEDYDAIGWSMGDGETWPTAVDYDHYTAIAFGSYARAAIFDTEDTFPPDEPWWREMVPGDPLLIDDGIIVEEDCYSHMCERHPRTAAGLTEDGRTAILVTVDGRSESALGMTRAELAELMLELGAWRALNLDGGGSTTFWLAGEGVLNEPSDGSERVVASSLGFTRTDEVPCCPREPVEGATGIFADVPDDHWARGYAEALYEAGITTGCEDDPLMFCPDCVLDRATLAVLVARALGLAEVPETAFDDVEPTAWYAGYVQALYDAGITQGCGSGLFCPDHLATRWEVAAFVFRGMGIPEATPVGLFDDVSADRAGEIEALAEACVVSGCAEDRFCPDQEATRAQAAKMIAIGFSVGDYAPCLDGGGDDDTAPPDDDTAPPDDDLPADDDAAPPGDDDADPADDATGPPEESEPYGCSGCDGAPSGPGAGAPLAVLLAITGIRRWSSARPAPPRGGRGR